MGTFVTSNTPLPPAKIDAFPPQGMASELDAADINNLWSAAGDLRDHVLGRVNVKSSAYGAKGDGVTDDSLAIQLAWAVAAATSRKLYLPAGTYIMNSGLPISASFLGGLIEGEGINCVTIKAGAAMTSMFSFSGNTQSFQFRNLTLDGNSLAQYGFNGPQFAYGKLDKVRVRGTTVAGFYFKSGWDNVLRDCEARDNSGDGIQFDDTAANDVSLYSCLISGNGGWGLKFKGGGPFLLRSGAIQGNAFGGIYVMALGKPFTADGVYFEGNAQTGFAFSSPSKTVKADIVLNGSGVETTLAHAFDSRHVSIRNCLSTATYTEAFIYVASASTMSVIGNVCPGTAVPLLKTYGDTTYASPSNISISGNQGFSKDFDVESVTGNRSIPFSTWFSDTARLRNYFPTHVYAIPKLTGVAGSVLSRGSVKYNGRDTIDITGAAGDRFGIQFDLTNVQTELAGVLVYISAWAKVSSTANSVGPRLTIGGIDAPAQAAADTNWHHIEFANILPSSGSLNVAISKLNGIAGDVVTFADVTIAVVGAPDRLLVRDLLTVAAPNSVSADRGDANQTLTAGSDAKVQRWATTLTANRTVTLSATGALDGDTFRVVRTGLGAFTLDVGGLKTIPSGTAAFVDVTYSGPAAAWVLTGYGTL